MACVNMSLCGMFVCKTAPHPPLFLSISVKIRCCMSLDVVMSYWRVYLYYEKISALYILKLCVGVCGMHVYIMCKFARQIRQISATFCRLFSRLYFAQCARMCKYEIRYVVCIPHTPKLLISWNSCFLTKIQILFCEILSQDFDVLCQRFSNCVSHVNM